MKLASASHFRLKTRGKEIVREEGRKKGGGEGKGIVREERGEIEPTLYLKIGLVDCHYPPFSPRFESINMSVIKALYSVTVDFYSFSFSHVTHQHRRMMTAPSCPSLVYEQRVTQIKYLFVLFSIKLRPST